MTTVKSPPHFMQIKAPAAGCNGERIFKISQHLTHYMFRILSVVKVGGNAMERRSRAPKMVLNVSGPHTHDFLGVPERTSECVPSSFLGRLPAKRRYAVM